MDGPQCINTDNKFSTIKYSFLGGEEEATATLQGERHALHSAGAYQDENATACPVDYVVYPKHDVKKGGERCGQVG